ncbi:hypothetical protein HDV00_007737 [Rhizophlyctis rosea]|nr:hypothetical protein HDV00_007737 [Rhizophlyctis rosea]
MRLAVLGHHATWRGFGGRIRAYHSYLLTLPPDTIAILSDAYDVLLQPTCTSADILAAFKAQRSPIVFTAEVFCFPDVSLASSYPTPSSHLRKSGNYIYLNAGTVIGRVRDLLLYLEESYGSDCDDDQANFTRVFLSRYLDAKNNATEAGVVLDYEQNLFMSIAGTPFEDLETFDDRGRGRRVRNSRTEGEGCIIHQNGGHLSKKPLKRVADLLNVAWDGVGI